jgi:membrane-associated phospholipid phosphatase
MKSTACKLFLFLYLVFAMGLLCVVLCTEQAHLHLALTLDYLAGLNPTWVGFQDQFFKYITELGSSVPFIIMGGLLFYKVGDALFLLVAQLFTAAFVFPIKHLVSAPRPSLFFHTHFPDVVLHQVDGVTLHQIYSFPSGHTVNAFALFFCLALITKNKWIKFLCFVAAALVGYSRIYLSQHFAIDVLPGSLIGVISAWMVYPYYLKLHRKWQKHSLADYFIRNKGT